MPYVTPQPRTWHRSGSALRSIASGSACRAGLFDKPKCNSINCVRSGQPYSLQAQGDFCAIAFTRNPAYFLPGQPYIDGVEWLVLEDESTGLAMYRTGQIDCGPWHWWSVRQADLEAFKQSQPNLVYRDFLSVVASGITMRTDQLPFNDVRVRRAISHALDRQGLIEGVYLRGEPTPAIGRGLTAWSLPV